MWRGLVPPSIPRLGSFLDERQPRFKPESVACFVVSDAFEFIFVKMGKNGGSSVEKILKKALCGNVATGRFGGKCANSSILNHGQHVRDRALANFCLPHPPPREKWSSYFKFAFVRAPAARRVSMIEYCGVSLSLKGCARCATLTSNVSRTPSCGVCSSWHCAAQRDAIVSSTNGTSTYVDYVGRTETLGIHMDAVLHIIAARYIARTGGTSMPWMNTTQLTDIKANVDSSAYIAKADKRPPPLACAEAECLALTNNATDGFYEGDEELFGTVT